MLPSNNSAFLLSNVSSISGVHDSSLTLVPILPSSSLSSVLPRSSEQLLSSALWLSDTSVPLSVSSEGSLPQSGHSSFFDVHFRALKDRALLNRHWTLAPLQLFGMLAVVFHFDILLVSRISLWYLVSLNKTCLQHQSYKRNIKCPTVLSKMFLISHRSLHHHLFFHHLDHVTGGLQNIHRLGHSFHK